MSSLETFELMRSIKEVELQMVGDRGFDISSSLVLDRETGEWIETDQSNVAESVESIRTFVGADAGGWDLLSSRYRLPDDDSEEAYTLAVYYIPPLKTRSATKTALMPAFEIVKDFPETQDLVIITPVAASASEIDNLKSGLNITLTLYLHEEMIYNVVDHRFYSPHTQIEGEEYTQLVHNSDKNQQPLLLLSDAVSKYHNFRPSTPAQATIIRIDRKAPFDGVYYRVVPPGP